MINRKQQVQTATQTRNTCRKKLRLEFCSFFNVPREGDWNPDEKRTGSVQEGQS